jgi:hypothetical protein
MILLLPRGRRRILGLPGARWPRHHELRSQSYFAPGGPAPLGGADRVFYPVCRDLVWVAQSREGLQPTCSVRWMGKPWESEAERAAHNSRAVPRSWHAPRGRAGENPRCNGLASREHRWHQWAGRLQPSSRYTCQWSADMRLVSAFFANPGINVDRTPPIDAALLAGGTANRTGTPGRENVNNLLSSPSGADETPC